MDYIDEQTTKIHIELDVMQTYFFDITDTNTFVEREHVVNDTAGNHTIPEGLETGEYICGSSGQMASSTFIEGSGLSSLTKWAIVMQVVPDSEIFDQTDIITRTYGGVYSGCMFIAFYGLLTEYASIIVFLLSLK